MASQTEKTSPCSFVVGDDGLATWSDTHKDAWIGLLETHKRLTRALDAQLETAHGLTLSGLEVLGRLAAAPGRCLRLSDVAPPRGPGVRGRSGARPRPLLALFGRGARHGPEPEPHLAHRGHAVRARADR